MPNNNFLEANETLREENLRIVKNEFENDIKNILAPGQDQLATAEAPPRDFQIVQPKAGFCLKSLKVNSDEKFFTNVCHTESMPPPEDISEEQLLAIISSDTPNAYRIPMSVSEPRMTKDKAGNRVAVSDIAINTNFFHKVEKSTVFRHFFIAIIAETLSDKYNIQLNIDKAVILKNRKLIGSLVSHRLYNSDIKTVLKSHQNLSPAEKKQLTSLSNLEQGSKGGKKPLVQEIDSAEVENLKKEAQRKALESSVPMHKFRLRTKNNGRKELQAEFYLPRCANVNDFSLDIGEDRLVLQSERHNYNFDKFVDYSMDSELAQAIFDKTSKMLVTRIPILSP